MPTKRASAFTPAQARFAPGTLGLQAAHVDIPADAAHLQLGSCHAGKDRAHAHLDIPGVQGWLGHARVYAEAASTEGIGVHVFAEQGHLDPGHVQALRAPLDAFPERVDADPGHVALSPSAHIPHFAPANYEKP